MDKYKVKLEVLIETEDPDEIDNFVDDWTSRIYDEDEVLEVIHEIECLAPSKEDALDRIETILRGYTYDEINIEDAWYLIQIELNKVT
jgi:hypothetical protein